MSFTPKTNVIGRHETQTSNWARAEEFKKLLYEGRVHAPEHALAELELRFLQQDGRKVHAPTMGPVQTDDLADAIMAVTVELARRDRSPLRQLSELQPVFGRPLGLPPDHPIRQQFGRLTRQQLYRLSRGGPIRRSTPRWRYKDY